MRHLISLGKNCDVAFQLRMHGHENVPHFFDWLGTPTAGLIKTIKLNFDVFYPDDLALNTNHPHHFIYDQVTGIVFFHQFPLYAGKTHPDFLLQYKSFIKIFRFQARRFREYVTTLPVTLVRREITKPEALLLEEAFFERFPGADVRFLYINYGREVFTTTHGHSRVIPGKHGSLGNPAIWAKLLTKEGLIGTPYRHSTVEILGASHADHSLNPDDRFSEGELLAAIAGNPEHPGFPLELARHYRKREMFAPAEVQIGKSLALDPKSAEAIFEQIVIHWRSNTVTPDEAAERFIELARKNQVGGLLRSAASALFAAGRLDESIDYCVKALDQNPTDHAAYFLKADGLFRKRKFDAALRAVEKAVMLDGEREFYHHLHAKLLDELGRLKEAIEAERKAIAALKNFQSLVHLGSLLKRTGQAEAGIAALRESLPLAGGLAPTVQGWIESSLAETAATKDAKAA